VNPSTGGFNVTHNRGQTLTKFGFPGSKYKRGMPLLLVIANFDGAREAGCKPSR